MNSQKNEERQKLYWAENQEKLIYLVSEKKTKQNIDFLENLLFGLNDVSSVFDVEHFIFCWIEISYESSNI